MGIKSVEQNKALYKKNLMYKNKRLVNPNKIIIDLFDSNAAPVQANLKPITFLYIV